MLFIKIWQKSALIALSLLFFTTACFDYYEEVELGRDFSGSVFITYIVPRTRNPDNPYIAFLPVRKDQIKWKYQKFIDKKEARFVSLAVTPITTEEKEELVKPKNKQEQKAKIKVSYQIEFTNPDILESTPLSNVKVNSYNPSKIEIKRSFAHIKSSQHIKAFLVKPFYEYLIRKLGGHKLYYTTSFSEDLQVSSNRGKLVNNGKHSYVFPLKASLTTAKKPKLVASPKAKIVFKQ